MEDIISEEEFEKLPLDKQKKLIGLLDLLPDEAVKAVYEEVKRISVE
jgi:hypothetical protein